MYGKWRHSTWLVIMIPQFIATVCAFSAFFTDICYSYNSYNEFVRGPLGYMFHWVTIFYMVLMGYCILRHEIMATRGENNAMISILLCMGVAMGIEVLAPEINNLVRSAMVFSTIATVYSFQASKLNREMAAIKENEKLRAELGEVIEEKMKSDYENSSFLAHMSRDIRAPLNAILSLVDINENSSDENVIRENRDKVKNAAEHLQNLVTSVVQINKLDDGEVELENEPFNIRELTENVLSVATARTKAAGLEMDIKDYEREFKCPYVYGSSMHVRQIIMNIMDNCIKFNRPGGQVGCQVTRMKIEDGKVWYQYLIWDTGCGISRDFIDKVFEPFSQEHADEQDEYSGAGLGLYIVKTLVDMMGGTIEVTSKVGEGTNFIVILPFKIASRDATLSAKAQIKSDAIEGINVLIADDNRMNMQMTASVLTNAGAKVTTTGSGAKAVDIFASSPEGTFDVILMDYKMPEMGGVEAARLIRNMDERPCGAEIPIIAMTSHAFPEELAKCREVGMNGYLKKPVNPRELINTITTELDSSK